MEFNLKNIGNAVTHVTGVASHIHSGLSMIAPLFGKKVNPLDEGTTTTPPDQKKKGGLFSIDDEVGYGQLLTELDRKYIGFITGCTNDHYYDFAHPERRDGLKGLLRRAEAERKFDGYRTIVTNMTKNGLRKAQLEEIVKADITRRAKIRLSDTVASNPRQGNQNRGRNQQQRPILDKSTTTTTKKWDEYTKEKPYAKAYLEVFAETIKRAYLENLTEEQIQRLSIDKEANIDNPEALAIAYEAGVDFLRATGIPVMSAMSDEPGSFGINEIGATVGQGLSAIDRGLEATYAERRAQREAESGRFIKFLEKFLK